jgi:osmotically-inducible protein OsmY
MRSKGMDPLGFGKETLLADQSQKRKDKGAADKPLDNQAPSPTDMDFYSDPVIYEQGDVTSADQETHEKHGSASGAGPLGNRRPDEDIKAEIHSLLAYQKTIDASGIHVDVKDGVVTLSGNVPGPYEKQVATDLTGNVLGVQETHNILTTDEQDAAAQK